MIYISRRFSLWSSGFFSENCTVDDPISANPRLRRAAISIPGYSGITSSVSIP
jgi:hypothetical protein